MNPNNTSIAQCFRAAIDAGDECQQGGFDTRVKNDTREFTNTIQRIAEMHNVYPDFCNQYITDINNICNQFENGEFDNSIKRDVKQFGNDVKKALLGGNNIKTALLGGNNIKTGLQMPKLEPGTPDPSISKCSTPDETDVNKIYIPNYTVSNTYDPSYINSNSKSPDPEFNLLEEAIASGHDAFTTVPDRPDRGTRSRSCKYASLNIDQLLGGSDIDSDDNK